MDINDLDDDNYEIPDLQDEDDEIIDEEELEILKLQDEVDEIPESASDEIPESAPKQREDNDGVDDNSARV